MGTFAVLAPDLVYKWFRPGSPRAKKITRGNLGQGKERRQQCGLRIHRAAVRAPGSGGLAGLGALSVSHPLESSSYLPGALRNLEKLDTRLVSSLQDMVLSLRRAVGVMSPQVTTTWVVWDFSVHPCAIL